MGDDKVVSIFELAAARARREREQEAPTALAAALEEFQQKILDAIDPIRRYTRATVYAANHAAEWRAEGARLQSLRERAGVSRAALARAVGVSAARIARLEAGMPVADARLLRAAYLLFLEKRS